VAQLYPGHWVPFCRHLQLAGIAVEVFEHTSTRVTSPIYISESCCDLGTRARTNTHTNSQYTQQLRTVSMCAGENCCVYVQPNGSVYCVYSVRIQDTTVNMSNAVPNMTGSV
jgi:hypothetical protein